MLSIIRCYNIHIIHLALTSKMSIDAGVNAEILIVGNAKIFHIN